VGVARPAWYVSAVPVTQLASGDTTFHVIGTAHVSAHSVEEVRDTIARLRPDVVCVELDRRRFEALTRGDAFRDLDVRKVVRDGRALYVLAQVALTAYQRRIGARLGIKPGAELLAAVEAAQAAGIPVELIDRDIDITLKRAWRSLGPWRRLTLLSSLFVSSPSGGAGPTGEVDAKTIEDLKQPKALSDMLAELGRAVPEIKRTVVDERDQYLVSRMIEAGRGRRRVVAVVGAAHVPGMEAQFGAPIDRAALERIPPPSRVARTLRWLVPIAFAAALIHGWRSDPATLVGMVRAWILPTSIGAAVTTLAAGGSLLSVLSALVVAPIAALHPRIRTGMVVGAVEAWRRRPTPIDRERLTEDLQSFRGFWHNPVTRIFLVAIASGAGTAIGFWIAVGWVLSLL